MLFVVYNFNFITKFVLILPVFYYHVTLNFFLQSTYFWLTLYKLILQKFDFKDCYSSNFAYMHIGVVYTCQL